MARRCYELGRALGRAIASWDGDQRVGIATSGGLSHFVIEGKDFDREILRAMRERYDDALSSIPENYLMSGNSEIKNWIALAGVMADQELQMDVLDYVPCYRTEAATAAGWGSPAGRKLPRARQPVGRERRGACGAGTRPGGRAPGAAGCAAQRWGGCWSRPARSPARPRPPHRRARGAAPGRPAAPPPVATAGATAAAAPTATAAPPAAAAPVRVATLRGISDAALLIAQDRGYFGEEGLAVELVPLVGAQAPMLLSTNQLEAVGTSVTAGSEINAAQRGVALKVVADKGSAPPGHGFNSLVIRKRRWTAARFAGSPIWRGGAWR